jgi:hypothetical protein
MDIKTLIGSEWGAVVAMMPADFESSAREEGAIQRARKVVDAATLLRLALIYATSGGLRLTAALAAEQGMVDLSDVAVLKRLRVASRWLAGLPSRLLEDKRQYEAIRCRIGRRIRLVDATTVSRPGSTGTDWRVHVGYSLSECRIDHVELTDARGGETLTRIPVERGDILVADRGYSQAKGISDAVAAGADVLVRLNSNSVPLTDPDGAPFKILECLRSLPVGAIGEWSVCTVAKPAQGVTAVRARLVAVRKTEAAAEVARSKLRRQGSKNGHTPSTQSLEAAAYMFLLTTVSADEMSAEQCLEIYRFRWQIELAFKNLKSVIGLSKMAAKSPELSTAYISAILVTAILVDRLATAPIDFSPWGYATPWHLLPDALPQVLA